MIQVQDVAAAQALQETYGLLGKVALGLDETIVPVAIVDTLELGKLRQAYGLASLGGAAAVFSNIQTFNPTGSGVLVTVAGVLVSLPVIGTITVREHDVAIGAETLEKGWRDRRRAGGPIMQMREEQNAAALGNTRLRVDLGAAAQFFDVPLGTTLLPGQGLVIVPTVVNVRIDASWFWTERNLLPSE